MKLDVQQSQDMLMISHQPKLGERLFSVGICLFFGFMFLAAGMVGILGYFGIVPFESGPPSFGMAFGLGLVFILIGLFMGAAGIHAIFMGESYFFDLKDRVFQSRKGKKINKSIPLSHILCVKKVLTNIGYRSGTLYKLVLEIEKEDSFELLEELKPKDAHDTSQAISQFLAIPVEEFKPLES